GFKHVHDAHRTAPGNINRAREEPDRRLSRRRRGDQLDRDTFLSIGAERQCRVIGCVEQAAQVFLQGNGHLVHPTARRMRSAASANPGAPSTMSSSLLSSARWWLTPPMLGINIMPAGIRYDSTAASWPAALGSRICIPGACRSAATSICLWKPG